MEEDKNAEKDRSDIPKQGGEIDLDAILLPKKDPVPGHTLESAARRSAGDLLAQEASATLTKPEPLEHPKTPAQPKEELLVRPIETYQGDIERVVQKQNVSVVSIAAAQAKRSAKEPLPQAPPSHFINSAIRSAMIVGGIMLLGASATLAYLIYERTQPLSVSDTFLLSPFISVDATQEVVFREQDLNGRNILDALDNIRMSATLPLGLMGRFLVTVASSTERREANVAIDAQKFLATIAPDIPQELLRTIAPTYLLGVHSYDGNQSFLIMRTDSYQQAFSGMLKWERTIEDELAPLFTRRPGPQILGGEVASPTTTAPQIVQTKFVDIVAENVDARAIIDEYGSILLLWTMLADDIIVVTTNEYTLKEILSRFAISPGSIEE